MEYETNTNETSSSNLKKKRQSKKEKKIADVEQATNSDRNIKKWQSPFKDVSSQMKEILKDVAKIPTVEDVDIENVLAAIGMGIIPDRFGMEVSVDTRIKALTELSKIRNEKAKREALMEEQVNIEEEFVTADNFIVKQREQVESDEEELEDANTTDSAFE